MISVYCDGSSHVKNYKPIGWGWVIVREGEALLSGSGCSLTGTNNIAELMGAIEGLQKLISLGWHRAEEMIELVSDSQYVLGMAAGAYSPTKNLELVEAVRALTLEANARTRWVKGHSGEPFNEQCDKLAHTAKLSLVRSAPKKPKKSKEPKNGKLAQSAVSTGTGDEGVEL